VASLEKEKKSGEPETVNSREFPLRVMKVEGKGAILMTSIFHLNGFLDLLPGLPVLNHDNIGCHSPDFCSVAICLSKSSRSILVSKKCAASLSYVNCVRAGSGKNSDFPLPYFPVISSSRFSLVLCGLQKSGSVVTFGTNTMLHSLSQADPEGNLMGSRVGARM
jgi:hypothetical protein